MSESHVKTIIAVMGMAGLFFLAYAGAEGRASSEEEGSVASSIQVIAGGQVFSSMNDYRQAEKERQIAIRARQNAGMPFLLKNEAAVKSELPPVTAPLVAPVTANVLNGLKSAVDENGWKTVWVNGGTSATAPVVPEPVAQTGSENVSVGTTDPAALSPKAGLPGKDVITVSRILGVHPAMTDIVRDFEKAAALGSGDHVLKVATQEELIERLQTEAEGKTGPFLILSGHGRIRLLGLESADPVLPDASGESNNKNQPGP